MTDAELTKALLELHFWVARGQLKIPMLRNRINELAERLSIDLDEAKRVWREYRPEAQFDMSPAYSLPATLLEMHRLIVSAEEWRHERSVRLTDFIYVGGKVPSGFPIYLARLDLMAEELEKL